MNIKEKYFTNKRILVTGGLGFIGSHLIRALIQKYNSTILNLDSKSYCSMPEALNDIKFEKNYNFIKNNLSDSKLLIKIIQKFKPNYIFHLAAESHVDNSISSPENFMQTNILGTYNLINAINLSGLKQFKFIHISTDEVYGSLHNKRDKSFTENSKFLPNSPYAASKASSDLIVRAWIKTFNFPAIITNCVNNFGPWQFPEKLIPVVISKCLLNKKIPVYGNGKNIREWIFVQDHVNFLIKIMIKGKVGETYNIGSGYEIENIHLINKICKYFDIILPRKNKYNNLVSFVKDRMGHDYRYSLNSKKTNKFFKHKINKKYFDTKLHETINWYINKEKWINKRLKSSK